MTPMKIPFHPGIRELRLVAGFALIGSVLTGAFFGWIDLPFDPRPIGAALGALAGIIKTFD
jgi:hypothetical protein